MHTSKSVPTKVKPKDNGNTLQSPNVSNFNILLHNRISPLLGLNSANVGTATNDHLVQTSPSTTTNSAVLQSANNTNTGTSGVDF